jgi:hypothetical protein
MRQAGKMDAHPSGWQWTFEPEQKTLQWWTSPFKGPPRKAWQISFDHQHASI